MLSPNIRPECRAEAHSSSHMSKRQRQNDVGHGQTFLLLRQFADETAMYLECTNKKYENGGEGRRPVEVCTGEADKKFSQDV